MLVRSPGGSTLQRDTRRGLLVVYLRDNGDGVFDAGSDDNVAVVYDSTKLAIVIAIFVAILFIIILICFEVADCCRQARGELLSCLRCDDK